VESAVLCEVFTGNPGKEGRFNTRMGTAKWVKSALSSSLSLGYGHASTKQACGASHMPVGSGKSKIPGPTVPQRHNSQAAVGDRTTCKAGAWYEDIARGKADAVAM